MGQSTIDAVLAGTKSFAVALLAPLTARIGNRPRLAADPSQVLGLCSGPSALAVVEFTGEGSLGTIQALVRDGKGLRVVAGVPTAHAGAEGTLLALGVEVGRWDGKIDGVVLAVERAVTAMASAPSSPAPSRPAVAAPKPTAPGAAAAAPRPAPAAPAPRPSPAAAPGASKPAAVPPGRAAPPGSAAAAAPIAPRPPAAGPVAPRPPAEAAKPAAAPPVASPARPTAVPGTPAAAAAARVASAAAPGPAPQRTGPPQAPPRAAPVAPPPAAEPPPPMLSRQPASAPPAAPSAAPAQAAAPAPSARPPASFFDDLGSESEDVSIDEDVDGTDFHAPGVYVPPPRGQKPADWPATVCTDAEAEDALRRVLAGKPEPGALFALAASVLDSVTPLERRVLSGEGLPFEPGPIRKAIAMRLRVAEALASVPPPGSAVDAAALSGMLGRIDALLAEVATLSQGASEESAPALEAIRNYLVREAIDFSEAAQRVAAPAQPAPAAAPSAAPRAQQARVLAVAPESEADRAERRRSVVLGALLAVIVLSAAAYHGYGYWKRSQLVPAPPPLDVPAGYLLPNPSAKLPIVLMPTGKPDRAALQKFREAQEALGRDVYELQNGAVLVVPKGTPRPPGSKP